MPHRQWVWLQYGESGGYRRLAVTRTACARPDDSVRHQHRDRHRREHAPGSCRPAPVRSSADVRRHPSRSGRRRSRWRATATPRSRRFRFVSGAAPPSRLARRASASAPRDARASPLRPRWPERSQVTICTRSASRSSGRASEIARAASRLSSHATSTRDATVSNSPANGSTTVGRALRRTTSATRSRAAAKSASLGIGLAEDDDVAAVRMPHQRLRLVGVLDDRRVRFQPGRPAGLAEAGLRRLRALVEHHPDRVGVVGQGGCRHDRDFGGERDGARGRRAHEMATLLARDAQCIGEARLEAAIVVEMDEQAAVGHGAADLLTFRQSTPVRDRRPGGRKRRKQGL